jgi:hypothetical protein
MLYNTYLSTGAPASDFATVQFPLKAILQGYRQAYPTTPVGTPGSGAKSPKSRPRTIGRGASGLFTSQSSEAVNSTVYASASASAEVAQSAGWIDNIWLGMINKSWADYQRDNPTPPPPTPRAADHDGGGGGGGEGGGHENENSNGNSNSNGNGNADSHGSDADSEAVQAMPVSDIIGDDFIMDPHRTKTEPEQRKQIRELILAYLCKAHER